MIRINLLPPEILLERRRSARLANILKGLLFLSVLLAVSFNLLFALTLRTNSMIDESERQMSLINEEISQYQPYQLLQNRNNDRSRLVRAAMGIQPAWRETLGNLGAQIPANVWLTMVSMTRQENAAVVSLHGLTYDHPSTARWADILSGTPGIGAVRVLYSSEENLDGQILVRFELRAEVTAAAAFEPLGGDGKNE